ncbi:MAG TPA: hypothetical protein DDY77_00050 [Clostridiales bacterium]|nr:hypothetical protein [Clostridiales bacterium]
MGKENNGTTIAAMNLIRFLKNRGHEVRVLCADDDKKGQEGYYVVPKLNLGKLLNNYVEKVGVTLAKPDDDIIREALSGADIAHIMVPLLLGMRATKIAVELGVPLSAGFHMQAENFTSYFKVNKIKLANQAVYDFIYEHVYKYVDAIHYPTQFIRNVFERAIKKETPGYVISNGVNAYVKKRDIPKPEEYKDKIVILSTGRYAREKSQDTLIKAVSISKHKDEIALVLGGQGIKEKEYRALAEKVGVKPVFKFFSRTEIIDVLNYSDMYVHPAEIELEGISCIEAIACGKLTIVSDSPLSATKEFAVDERCVFKCRDEKDLARVIDYWIENPEEKAKVEEKYLASGIAFDQEKCMEKMEQMLFSAIEKHKEKA